MISRDAFVLMQQKNVFDAFDEMDQKKGLPLMEALTFAVCNTPIIFNKTQKIVGYVLFWHNNFCSVHTIKQNDWLETIGMEIHDWPSLEEAVDLYEKYLAK